MTKGFRIRMQMKPLERRPICVRLPLFSLIIFLFLSLLSCCREQPTENRRVYGAIVGGLFLYGEEPSAKAQVIAFASNVPFVSMPTASNFISYLGNDIVEAEVLRYPHYYFTLSLANGTYYLNIGTLDEEPDTSGETSPFPFMSYHSPEYLWVGGGDVTYMPAIWMMPGGKSMLKWVSGQQNYRLQGFNFTLMRNVSSLDSADLWYDGENEMLRTPGMGILEMSSEPEGLCHMTDAPISGYVDTLSVPFGHGGAHFIVRTQDSTYVKARIIGGGGSGDPVTERHIVIQWLHQADGSRHFSY